MTHAIMKNYNGDTADLVRSINGLSLYDTYSAVPIGNDTFLVKEPGCMTKDGEANWFYDVFRIVKKPSQELQYQEVAAVRVRKRKTLLDIARERSLDFEGHREEIEAHFDMTKRGVVTD